ncbi:MAG: hypothetical protein KDE09_20445, partial [Anaerolineales bacterium]|nr:hypothetical protein [Anaerolineales bacterium]
YPDGTLRNLTATAGYGTAGFQGSNAIAVRDPAVHWDGDKAIFSMVIGAPTQQYQVNSYHWQLYEVTGLGPADTPVITKVPNQPATFNNISPLYTSDDRIIFTSDRPRNGAEHHYPQRDEYESAPTVSGLWELNPVNGTLRLLNHAPSGDFTPTIDSFGRVIFTQWDHMQRDQQADADALTDPGDDLPYGSFNYSSEATNAGYDLDDRTEVYPEPRASRQDLLAGTNLVGHSFNHFFPWMMNQDGTELETLNHIGRQELHDYINMSINDDPNIVEYYGQYPRFNENSIENMLQIKEDPTTPGGYIGTNAPEFQTHAAGQLVSLAAPPNVNADAIGVVYLTHPDTASPTGNPGPGHSGLYRDPLPLSDGNLIAVHTAETRADQNIGTYANPESRYDFRLRLLGPAGNGYLAATTPLTGGISKSISYWDPDTLISYNGELWELQPVEVRPRIRPGQPNHPLPGPEQTIFSQAGVNPSDLILYMTQNNLALIVSRDVTTRDDLDFQQPFNLRVPGGVQTIGASGTVYDVAYIQIFQGDLLRGYTGGYGSTTPRPGRRVLATPMHEPAAILVNPPAGNSPEWLALGLDGSMAAFVPAGRAVTWQLLGPAGEEVVRERYWLTFQPGEIRVCASCHGLNINDQAGQPVPQNPPQALLTLLQHWQQFSGDVEKVYLPTVTND